jgi:TonB family protein
MTKNQKILLGCGGAGCLGIVVCAIVVFGIFGYTISQIAGNAPRRGPTTMTENIPAPATASMSVEDKHKLFHAAGVTKDQSLIREVSQRTGMLNPDGTPTPAFEPFIKEHLAWAIKNTAFIQEVKTPELARSYVSRYLPTANSTISNATSPNTTTTTTAAPPAMGGGGTPVSGGSLNSKALSLPPPAYPAMAKAARIQGAIIVQVTVDETGKVMSARAGGGHPLLRQAAEQAAYQARFSPTQVSGRPVKVSGQITYNFTLG